MNDTYYLAVSIIFVAIVLIIHFKSVFLTFVSLLIICFAFGTTGFICQYIVGMTYFNIFNNFGVFMVMGIAVDDFFVFFDAWQQSAQYKGIKSDNRKRLAFTLRRSFRTIYMTSLTTSVAFLATIFSPIMPIQAFGIYSSILIPMLFILTCTVLPPAVILHEKYFPHCFFFARTTGGDTVERKVEKISQKYSAPPNEQSMSQT